MADSLETLFNPEQLRKYSEAFKIQARILTEEVQSMTAKELSKKINEQIINELANEQWEGLDDVKIALAMIPPLKALPSQSECTTIESFFAYIAGLNNVHKNQLLQQAQTFNKKAELAASRHEFALRSSQSQTAELRRELSTLKTLTIILQQDLIKERIQNSTLKKQHKQALDSIADEKYMLERRVKDLEEQVKGYQNVMGKLELDLKLEECNADIVRIKMYALGLQQQEFDYREYRREYEETIRRYRLCESVYDFARKIQQGMPELKSDDVIIPGNSLEAEIQGVDIVTLFKEVCENTERTVKEIRNQHRKQTQKLIQNHQSEVEELTQQNSKYLQTVQNLKNQLKNEQQQYSKQLQRLCSLEEVYADLQSKICELEEQRIQQKLATEKINRQLLKSEARVRQLENSLQTNKLERASLHENLKLIVETSARHQSTMEHQKSIVEQVVEKNYDLKIRIKHLEDEIEEKASKITELNKKFESHQTMKSVDIASRELERLKVQKELSNKDAEISQLRSTLAEKQSYIAELLTKIQQCQENMDFEEDKSARIQELEEQLRVAEQSLLGASEALESLQIQAESLHKQKLAAEAETTILKQTQTLVVQNRKARDEEFRKLVEEVEDKLLRIRALEAQITSINSDYHKVVQQNSQLKNKIVQQVKIQDKSLQQSLEKTLKGKQNRPAPKDKQKYVQSILNLNELINYMMNIAKGYDFESIMSIKQNSWVMGQGSNYFKKMQSSTNLEGKMKNFLRMQQISQEDAKLKEVAVTFKNVMEFYLSR